MTDFELMQQALEAYDKYEPLALVMEEIRARLAHCDRCGKRLGKEGDIHTCTPPQRTWVGLTGDETERLIQMAQDALHMATLPFPIDEIKTRRALEAVDRVLEALEPKENT